jgi:prepilin-type N-terminal cleavage/methylation domain-containing protein
MQTILSSRKWFTMVELILSMVVFATIMTTVLISIQNMGVVRITTENRVTLLQELYYFSEKLVTEIKEWGSLDYEEYWNRQSYDIQIATGHYLRPTGVGNYGSGGSFVWNNYGSGLYYCRSGANSTLRMGTGGCLEDTGTGKNSFGYTLSGSRQRYGQYGYQFTDYNGNTDADLGDEDGNGNIIGDEDDREIGDAPTVISWSITELYLINSQEKTRTYFRWTYTQDNELWAPTCTMATWSGCLGNIQILKLRGVDRGPSHSGTLSESGSFDGVIDTWICHKDWRCAGAPAWSLTDNIATGQDSEWVDLFPDYINVKRIGFTAFPKKNPWKSWSAPDAAQWSTAISPFIHPYVRMELTLGFAWKKRKLITGDDPTITITTSASLGDTLDQ